MGQIMKRLLIVVGLVVGLGFGVVGYATAQEASVSATVTPQLVAVSVDPTSVAYGTLAVNTTDNLPTAASFDATNDGNVNADFVIKGSNTTPDNWTLAATAGSATYVHRFSSTGSGGTFTALTLTNQTLASAITAGSFQTVHLNLDMPTATTATAEQTASVTVLATAP